MDPSGKKTFWENKILQWERARYFDNTTGQSWVERLVGGGGGSLRHRQQMAADLLRPHVRDKIVLDAGCGSGLLFRLLADSDARGFVGIDLAEAAVRNARQLATSLGYDARATFIAGNVAEIDLPPFDIAVALGLLDWLTDDERERFFDRIKGKLFLLSFAESRASMRQLLHRLYVYVAYGRKTRGYVPRYYAAGILVARLAKRGFADVQVLRDKRLSLGAFLHNLPLF